MEKTPFECKCSHVKTDFALNSFNNLNQDVALKTAPCATDTLWFHFISRMKPLGNTAVIFASWFPSFRTDLSPSPLLLSHIFGLQ